MKYSNLLFEEIRKGGKIAVISEITIEELTKAPGFIIDNFKNLPVDSVEEIMVNQEMIDLAEIYLDNNIVTVNYREDALHIAIATVAQVDVLLSWNFKHIVNLNRIIQFNAVNLKEGYKPLEIRSPQEVLEND